MSKYCFYSKKKRKYPTRWPLTGCRTKSRHLSVAPKVPQDTALCTTTVVTPHLTPALSLDMPISLVCPPNCLWAFVYVVSSSQMSFPVFCASHHKFLLMCPHLLDTLCERLPHTAFTLPPAAMATASIQGAYCVSKY